MPTEAQPSGARRDPKRSAAVSSDRMLTDLPHVLLRRWYVVLVGLLATVGLISAVLVLLPLKYNARADVLLTPAISGPNDNPLLGLGDLEDVPTAIARSALSPTVVAELERQGITGGYSVSTDPTTPAPLVVIQATGTTPAAALHTMKIVYKTLVPPALQSLQRGVATRARVNPSLKVQSDATSPVTRTRTRALIAATALGLVLTALAAAATDRLLRTRRRKPTTTDTADIAATDRPAETDLPAESTPPTEPPEIVAEPPTRVEPAARVRPSAPAVRSVRAERPVRAERSVPVARSAHPPRTPRPKPAPANGMHPSSGAGRPRPKSATGSEQSAVLDESNSNIRMFPIRQQPGRHARD